MDQSPRGQFALANSRKLHSDFMSESLSITVSADRSSIYQEIAPQVAALVEGEADIVANLANVAAVLKEAFGFFWVGFYLLKGGQLVLGPFQGPLACTRINIDQGVCGHAFTTRQTVIVPNVDDFPGHIACSSASRSEIVLPIFGPDGRVLAVLDVDSEQLDDFSTADAEGLGRIVRIIERIIEGHTIP
jgi:L-methionine (R)-S-oxide reductase